VELVNVSDPKLPADPDVEALHLQGKSISEKIKTAVKWSIPLQAKDMTCESESILTSY